MNARRWPIRRSLRSLHRDAGYLAVGLTLVYAVSGLAVNHLKDWDPNFTQIEHTQAVVFAPELRAARLTQDRRAAEATAQAAMRALSRKGAFKDAYAVDDSHLDVTLDRTTLYVDVEKGTVREEGQQERFLLRLANWLHLNRGKKAWSYIADAYASALLFLAISGLFMIPGKLGLKGRGALLAGAGALVPILYVVLSGGP